MTNNINMSRPNNRVVITNNKYEPRCYMQVPMDFYYNEQDGDIIFGQIMLKHYQQYPQKKRYLHVINFMEDLYQMHTCKTYNDILYKAIVKFLMLIYPQKLREADSNFDLLQYAFILPEKYARNLQFINDTLRPIFEKATWLSVDDPKSKALFFSNWMCCIYSFQQCLQFKPDSIKLKRERVYVLCSIEKMANHDKFLVTLNTARMVYDPDFVEAAQGSSAVLESTTLLVPKKLDMIASMEFPINCPLSRMKRLAKFVYHSVFADSPDSVLGNDTLIDYFYNNKHYSADFMISFIITLKQELDNLLKTEQLGEQFYNQLRSEEPEITLDAKQRERLCRIKWKDIYSILDDLNWSCIGDAMRTFLASRIGQENISQAIIMTDIRYYKNSFFYPGDNWHGKFSETVSVYCFYLYAELAVQTISTILVSRNLTASVLEVNETIACLFKIYQMINLCGKLMHPAVIGANCEEASIESSPDAKVQNDAGMDRLIDRVKPYHCYVTAVVKSDDTIDLSLKQVVETSTGNNVFEKTTLSMLDRNLKMDSLYNSTSERLWENLLKEGADDMDINIYNEFTSKMTVYLKGVLSSGKSTNCCNLDHVIDFGFRYTNNDCHISISHRTIMEVGIAPYLDHIVASILDTTEDRNLFGRYPVDIIIITGDLLHQLIYDATPIYSFFIWNRLTVALAAQTYTRMTRLNVVMTKEFIINHHILNYLPLERAKYEQVFSKSLRLQILWDSSHENEVFINHGDHYEKVPVKKKKHLTFCTISLIEAEVDALPQYGLEKSIYLRIKQASPDMMENYYILELSEIFADEDITYLKDPTRFSPENPLLFTLLGRKPLPQKKPLSDEEIYKLITFPMKIQFSRQSFLSAIKLEMSLGSEKTLFDVVDNPERLTLRKIEQPSTC